MALQDGLLKIKGTLDNLTFYKTQDGMLVKMKSAISKDRILSDAALHRTRENMREFADAGTSTKMLRDAVRTFTKSASDNRVTGRIAKLMRKIGNMDTASARGDRKVANGIQTPVAKALLKDFNFNKNAFLGDILKHRYLLDTATGVININQLVPIDHIVYPKGTTHVRLKSAFITIDFATGIYYSEYSVPVDLPLDATISTVTLTPDAVPTINPGMISLYMLGLEFYQEVNGKQYQLQTKEFNCISIIDVQ